MKYSISNADFYQDLLLKIGGIQDTAKEKQNDEVMAEMHVLFSCMVTVRSARLAWEKCLGDAAAVMDDLGLTESDPVRKTQELFDKFHIAVNLSATLDQYAKELGYENFLELDSNDRFFVLLQTYGLIQDDVAQQEFDWQDVLINRVNLRPLIVGAIKADGDYEKYVELTS